jgi:hypothetical protein
MGFLVSFSFFFLAFVLSQATVVGQTTAEGVLEFPKNDIRDYKLALSRYTSLGSGGEISLDMATLSLNRRNAVISSSITCWDHPETDPWDPACTQKKIRFLYDNGVTSYDETAIY